MRKNYLAFTLIEILVWVSISTIIMISVGVFVTSGIKNITIQKSILNQENEYISLFEDLTEIFDTQFDIISASQTWLLIKTEGFKLWKPLLYDFSLQTFTGECLSDMNKEIKYLQMKNYNPFILNSGPFTGSYLRHEIYHSAQGKIVWKGIFWDNFQELAIGKDILLNNPGGLSRDGTQKTYISDTGNNRIMYYSGTKVSSILDFDKWLYQPTGLIYDSWNLFVLNSGKKELLKVSSIAGNITPINISQIIEDDITFDKISFEVLDNFTISWVYNTGSFIFSWISTGTGDSVSFSDNIISYNFSPPQNINSWNTVSFEIPTFTWWFDFYGASYLDIKFHNAGTIVYQKIFPYVIHSDNSLLTTSDNNIEILTGALNGYFTDISVSGSNLLLKDYINKTQLILSKTWVFISSWILLWTIPNFETTIKKYDLKIKDMQVSHSWNLLGIKIEYYKNFNCKNEDENIVKTFLFKKTLSD